MCGIAGIIDVRGNLRANPATVRAMCAAMQHRGPDGDGFFEANSVALGMRRLSIIDVAGSDQPLANEDDTISLVFNGEIYNYRELRRQLLALGHVFHTHGDGETLIHLYEEFGLELFDHLRGMYAFALWDANTSRLVLAIDHIGIKPLYLFERDGVLRFASEIKALFADDMVSPQLNLDALDTYLSFGFQVGPDTLFQNVRRLMPGHALVVENGCTREIQHWQFSRKLPPTRQPEAAIIQQTRELLAESTRLHLRSDVPLGLFLSGGVDSASMLALMAREETSAIKTFTVGYATDTPDNELLHARKIAAHFQTEHHEHIINAADWWQGFESYIYHEDEPTANASAVSLMLLAEQTAKHVKVVLTGLGGDELFGGYPHHHNIPALLRRQATVGWLLRPLREPLGALEAFYPAFKRYRVIGALPTYLPEVRRVGFERDEALLRAFSFDGMAFSDTLRDQLYGDSLKATEGNKRAVYEGIIADSWSDDPRDTAQALVINTWLHGNALLHADKVTMAHSLEGRVPLFDPRLLDHAANLPPGLRQRSNKYVLREAMRPYLPSFALNRPKQPFSTPIRGWFARDLRDNIRDVLLNPQARTRELFNTAALTRILQAHFEGREKQEEVVFRLLTLELWMNRFNVAV